MDPIKEYLKKLETQHSIVRAAQTMRQSTENMFVQQTIDTKIREAQKSILYLEDRIRELRIKQDEDSVKSRRDAPLPPPKDSNINRVSATFARGPYSPLDLIKSETPRTKAQVILMLQQLEFKLSVEKQYKEGIEKMTKLYARENDKRSIADAELNLVESKQKINLLKQSLRRYTDLHVDIEDNTPDEEIFVENRVRKPISGNLIIKVHAIGEVYHVNSFKNSKAPETFVVIKADDVVKARTKISRNEHWNEEFVIDIDKASEIEVTPYDRVSNQNLPIGLLWIRLSHLVDELRRRKVEQEFASTGWLTADMYFDQSNRTSTESFDKADTPLSAFLRERSLPLENFKFDLETKGLTDWFALEPSGKILLSLKFIRNNASKPKDIGFGLGRQGAIRQPKVDIYEKFGHKFAQQQFYQIMRCAFCGEFLKNAMGFQCIDCRFTCHKKCYQKVVTKCIAKSKSETDPHEAKLNHNIPHRFDALTNISANWCCHCGYILPLGKKNSRKCTECGITCHAQCTHLVPDFCGMSMEIASQILTEIKLTQKNREQLERKTVPDPLKQYENRIKSPHRIISRSQDLKDNSFSYYDSKHTENVREGHFAYQQSNIPRLDSIDRFDLSFKAENTNNNFTRAKVKQKQKRMGLEDFNFIAVLGKGNFGKVMLAEAIATKIMYAIKVLKKDFIIEHEEVESIKSEKRVFLIANMERHPFLVNLHSCFQTESRIYFVMEYIRGGDLMLHIQRQQFNLKRAKFYAAEVCLALKHFHENGIIYRDLKLDNILLCPDGHIKIADYGLCKEEMWYGDTTSTFCGTPEFMAPEILLDHKYTRAVDWWAFGVLIYQMLLGQSPFRGDDDEEIFQAILSDVPLYPIHMPKDSISILERLLVREPKNRLGSGPSDANEVMAHSFFRNINWDDLLAKKIEPPFKPTIAGDVDVSNFDSEFTSEKPNLTPVESKLSQAMQDHFKGFSVFCGD